MSFSIEDNSFFRTLRHDNENCFKEACQYFKEKKNGPAKMTLLIPDQSSFLSPTMMFDRAFIFSHILEDSVIPGHFLSFGGQKVHYTKALDTSNEWPACCDRIETRFGYPQQRFAFILRRMTQYENDILIDMLLVDKPLIGAWQCIPDNKLLGPETPARTFDMHDFPDIEDQLLESIESFRSSYQIVRGYEKACGARIQEIVSQTVDAVMATPGVFTPEHVSTCITKLVHSALHSFFFGGIQANLQDLESQFLKACQLYPTSEEIRLHILLPLFEDITNHVTPAGKCGVLLEVHKKVASALPARTEITAEIEIQVFAQLACAYTLKTPKANLISHLTYMNAAILPNQINETAFVLSTFESALYTIACITDPDTP